MAHNINIENGRAAFAYTGERPWHKLGVQVPSHMTTKEAIVAGGLDWIVDLHEMHIESEMVVDADGACKMRPKILVPDRFATVRRDTHAVLGIVGSGYEVVQNTEAFQFFDVTLGKGAACIETVGALGKGERIFAMAKLPKVEEIVAGDPVEQYLLLTTTHDGTGAVRVLMTAVRVVCQNTLSAALRRAKNIISIKHTKNVDEGLKKAKDLLTTSTTYFERATEAYKFMASKQMNKTEVTDFLKKLFPGKKLLDPETGEEMTNEDPATRTVNLRNDILRLFEGQATGAALAGTSRWGMFNAVTHYIDHERKGRNGASAWENSVLGLGGTLRQTAFDLLVGDQPKTAELQTV